MSAYVQDSIVLLGDSITEMGWQPYGIGQRLAGLLLAISPLDAYSTFATDMYCRRLDIINRGFSGYNTEWIIPVFEQVL